MPYRDKALHTRSDVGPLTPPPNFVPTPIAIPVRSNLPPGIYLFSTVTYSPRLIGRNDLQMIASSRGLVRANYTAQCLRFASSSARSSRSTQAKPRTKPNKTQPSRPITKPYEHDRPRVSRTASPPPPPPLDNLASIWRSSWLPLSGAALLAGFLGYYIFGTITATYRTPCCSSTSPCTHEHTTPTGRPPALDGANAEQFDKELNLGEWWMGITSLRKRIASHARGEVLELAMGTGRNLEYYDWGPMSGKISAKGITTFTGLDISVDMLDVARKRLIATVPPMKSSEPIVKASTMSDHTGGQLSFLSSRLRLIHSDAHHPLPPPPSSPSAKYDTIIQTFGLCSVSDPVGVLTNLASAVKPESGRIFLLEHGKGWYGIVNGLLDKNAGKHFDKYGCWWNRDIQGLVEEATRKTPGLQVVKIERPKVLQMGTMVWVELKMTDQTSKKA